MAIVGADYAQAQPPQMFSELKVEIARVVGGQDDEETKDIAGDCLNDTIEEVNFTSAWSFNLKSQSDITTISGTNEYPLASGFWKPYNVRKTDSIDFTLTYMSRNAFDARFEAQSGITGYPYIYTIYNEFDEGNLFLFPTPDGAYTIKVRYYQLIPRLIANGDSLQVPRPFGVVIKDGAKARICAIKGTDRKKMSYFESKFQDNLRKMAIEDKAIPDEKPRFVHIEEYGGWSYTNPAARPRYLDLY